MHTYKCNKIYIHIYTYAVGEIEKKIDSKKYIRKKKSYYTYYC